MRKIITLTLFDFKYLFRDFMLMVSIFAPIMLALIFRFGLPIVSSFLEGHVTFQLSEYRELFAILLLMTVPVMQGMFAAFIILDEQDEDIMNFLSVTPLSKEGYLVYRLGAPMVINIVLSFVALFVAGYQEFISLYMSPVILLLALEAPLVTLFIAGIAKNKVEGLAVAKVASILLLVPLAFYFVDSNWKFAAGILPPFWTVAAYFTALKSSLHELIIYLIITILAHYLFIHLLYNRFKGFI